MSRKSSKGKEQIKLARQTVYKGDCLSVVQKRCKKGTVDLVVADPPYNMGKNYEAYSDNKKVDHYIGWLWDRLGEIHIAMRPGGAFFLFINDGLVSEVDMAVKSLATGPNRFYKKSHIVWHYTFGQHHSKNFTPSHTHILYYVKGRKNITFNDEPIRHASARQVKYNDKRANPKGRLPDNTWVIFPELMPEAFDPAGDTWLASRVCGTYNERERHSPNQLPEPLVQRIVEVSSNVGDIVIDPFLGSGTTGAVCATLGRNFIGCDLSPTCVAESRKRIKSARAKIQD